MNPLTDRESRTQVMRLVVIGVLNTIDNFILFNLLRTIGIPRLASVVLAFVGATLISYVLNRRWTFGLAGNAGGTGEAMTFYAVNVVALVVTAGVVELSNRWFGPLDRIGENVALLVAGGLLVLPKFVSYREIVFGRALKGGAHAPGASQELPVE